MATIAQTMLIGILQFELLIHGAESLKDKRRVITSLKDRLHREHMASVAEIGACDNMHVARMGLAIVGSDGKHLAQCLDRITSKIRSSAGAELGDCTREILDNMQAAHVRADTVPAKDGGDDSIAAEMMERAESGALE